MEPDTWFTQPDNNYASCYAYDRENAKSVRIRLELGRDSDEEDYPEPLIEFHNNRAVGFGPDRYIGFGNNIYRWHHRNGHVFYDERLEIIERYEDIENKHHRSYMEGLKDRYEEKQKQLTNAGGGVLYCCYDLSKEVRKLSWKPEADLDVFDFTINSDNNPPSGYHHGNKVKLINPNLPRGIDEEQMKLLAKKILEDEGARLCDKRYDNQHDWYYIIARSNEDGVLAHNLRNCMIGYGIISR
jgi:hypothetical protein